MKSKTHSFICIEPYTHIEVVKDNILLYNQLTGFFYEESKKEVIDIVRRLNNDNKVTVAYLTENELNNKNIKDFISNLRKYYLGDLIQAEKMPIQVSPILKIENRYETKEEDQNILSNLLELSIYVNNYDANKYTTKFLHMNKQFCSNSSGESKNNLHFKDIVDLIQESKKGFLSKINILGGNIFEYIQYDELINYLNSLKQVKDYYLYYKDDIRTSKISMIESNSNSNIKLLIDFPIQEDKLIKVSKYFKEFRIALTAVFIIENEKDLKSADKLSVKYSFDSTQYNPYYNSSNLDFFKTHIFIDKEDIIGSKPTKNDLFTNQTINSHYFGKLIVSSNGDIYSNPNLPKIGIIKDSIYDIVFKSLRYKSSWMLLRQNVFPCNQCVYRLFCPPISNYEYNIGQNNLCTIKTFVN